ncbi:hypothetical protein BH10ACI1_BH10ACI1_29740 [soil metagenome]
MKAIPKIFKASETNEKDYYSCPLCEVQKIGDKADTGWVLCPMVDNNFICLGCCLDYQTVAISEQFEDHPFYGLFKDLAKEKSSTPTKLRLICLQHQEMILRDKSSETESSDTTRSINQLLTKIVEIKDTIED